MCDDLLYQQPKSLKIKSMMSYQNIVTILGSMIIGMILMAQFGGMFQPKIVVVDEEELTDREEFEYMISYLATLTRGNYEREKQLNGLDEISINYNFTLDTHEEDAFRDYWISYYDYNPNSHLQSSFFWSVTGTDYYIENFDTTFLDFILSIVVYFAFDIITELPYERNYIIREYRDNFVIILIESGYQYSDTFYFRYNYLGYLEEFTAWGTDGFIEIELNTIRFYLR